MSHPEAETIRQTVSKAYAHAVTSAPSDQGGCCSAPRPKGAAARMAGYAAEQVSGLPGDAVTHSFGCGNPLAFSEVRPGQTVLDLGSGAGIDLLLAAKMVGPGGRVIGVDMTDEMIARARANIAHAGAKNVEVRKGIIEQLPVEDASVDWVISNCVINLSPEKDRVFAEIARVLKPGGRISISDIVVSELSPELREHKALYCSCVGGAISEEAYLEGLRKAGLEAGVSERFVYDAAHLVGLATTERVEQAGSCCGSGEKDLKELAGGMAGKVWSARFSGRKV